MRRGFDDHRFALFLGESHQEAIAKNLGAMNLTGIFTVHSMKALGELHV